MMKRAIVTGATGFVGRWLVRELLEKDVEVIAIVREGSKRLDMLPRDNRLSLCFCGMDEYESLPLKIDGKPETVFFHLAWEGVYGPKRIDLETQLKCVAASKGAVIAAKNLECVRFVGLGSIMEKESIAVAETNGAKPGMSYVYGEAKHMAHLVTKAVAADLGIEHLWPMLTNAYGELDDSTRFINATLNKIIDETPLEFTSGTQIYDFIHVQDVAKALITIAEKGKPFSNYMIGSGKATALRSFVERLGVEVAPDQELQFGNVPYTGVQLPESAFSIDNLKTDTDFSPEISFEDGIRRTMEWLKKEREKN